MTIQELEQLHDLRREIKLLQKRIAAEERTMAADAVTASGDDYPYTTHQVAIQGVPVTLVERLRRRERRLSAKVLDTEAWIDTVEDSQVRQAIMLYYAEGMSWKQAAIEMKLWNESTVRMIVQRFLTKK